MLIYKIFTAPQWAALEQGGESAGAPVDLADGFVHFSTGPQVAETAAKHFAGQAGLMLLAVTAGRLGPALRWEPSRTGDRGGALFPHLYATLRRSDVAWVRPLPLGPDGAHEFPQGMGE